MSGGLYEQIAVGSQVVAAVLFIIVLVYLWRRFLAPAVTAAQARKNAELVESEARRDAAQAEIAVAQREAALAEQEALAIEQRGRVDAERIREQIVEAGRAESDRVVRYAEGELHRGRGAARERLRAELLEKAVEIARTAALDVDAETDRRLVSETVDVADRGGRT